MKRIAILAAIALVGTAAFEISVDLYHSLRPRRLT